MEPSGARLILFDTSLHFIDTATDLRSRPKIEFLCYSSCIKFLCYYVLSKCGGTGWGVYVSPCSLDLIIIIIIISIIIIIIPDNIV